MESVLGGFFAGEFSSQIQMQYKKPVHIFVVSTSKIQYIHKVLIYYTQLSML